MNQNDLIAAFTYKDGELFRKDTGKQAGKSKDPCGYRQTAFNGNVYKTHRLIFMFHHGFFPREVDHINGNRSDNRIENLRSSERSGNTQNQIIRKDNKSGIKGVCWFKAANQWRVQIQVSGKKQFFGYFDDLELAGLAASEARDKLHGKWANHG